MSRGRQAEGRSVYNSYPSVEETEVKLARVRGLTRSGLFHLMYLVSGETECTYPPPHMTYLVSPARVHSEEVDARGGCCVVV